MTDQLDLFSPAKSVEARTEALARVKAHADEEFKDRAWETVKALTGPSFVGIEFTTDDLVSYMSEWFPSVSTHDNRAWGPIMRAASKAGLIQNTGRVRESNMVSNHRRPKTIWRVL